MVSCRHAGSRTISFRRRIASHRLSSQTADRQLAYTLVATVEDLTKYARGENPDDYRHRMIVNVVAFVFVIGLIAAGLWLADTMAAMRKNQDCVLSGRRGCTPVEVTKDRW